MDCAESKELMAAYIEDLLDEEKKRLFTEHLKGCSACQAEVTEISNLRDRLVKNGEVLSQGGLEDVVLDRIIREQNVRLKAATQISAGLKMWRIIMRSRITKLAAAAVIIIAVVLSINVLDKSIPTVYGLEQTIEANHTIKTIHLREFLCEDGVESGEFIDCWVKYNDAGLVSNFRQNFHGDVGEDDDNLRFTVWNEGVLKTWMPLKNVVIIIRENNVEEYWQNFAKNYDPKLILQRLYDEQKSGAIEELRIEENPRGDVPIYIEATNSVDKTLLELHVDSETKLVKQFSIYSLGEDGDKLDMRVEFLAYNQPIDQSVFELSGIPDDALVYDQVGQLVGLEKGDLTDEEIAIKVVRACLEATIAHDYDEVSRLMEGDPGDSFEEFIEDEFGARLVRVVSIGQPEPDERWSNILCVPCEVEIENGKRGKWIVNIIATSKAIGYQPGNRWIVHTDIEVDAKDRGCYVKGIIVPQERVGEYTFDMSKDDILEKLGEPKKIFYWQERFTLDSLPIRYYMVFHDITFLIVDDSIKEISVHKPSYEFANGLRVGDSEQSIKEAFGNDFHLRETEWKDYLSYKDKGIVFEIHKDDRTVMEISISSPDKVNE